MAFCHWLGESLGHQVRLPSEAEWERAARHTDGRLWPWGDKFSPEKCNMGETGIGATSPVGIFPSGRAECGALDMAGNVWEWCCTRWLDNYEDYEVRVSNNLEGGVPHVVRGGSWFYNHRVVRCAYRDRINPRDRNGNFGFRVVAPGL